MVWSLGLATAPAMAQACTPLKPVGLGGDDGATAKAEGVKKSISPASTGVTKDNWNTDFEIPKAGEYRSYRVAVTTDSDGQYDLVSYLKYPNEKDQNIYERKGVSLGQGKTLTFSGTPNSKTIAPYQVNVYFGGALSTGKSYTVAAYGCK
jgi:hypothetical protein